VAENRARYALYLIPPYSVVEPVAGIHALLRKQFGLAAASKFMVHVTIKGFFARKGGPLEPLLERLDVVMGSQRPFPVQFSGVHRDPVGIGLLLECPGQGADCELNALHERVYDAVAPMIVPGCSFSEEERRQPFSAHITLAFRDIPEAMQDEVLDYIQDAPLPAEAFVADRYHFVEFQSQDWAGEWADTLTWRLIKTWRV
jgi:2'-5' RNA ligase